MGNAVPYLVALLVAWALLVVLVYEALRHEVCGPPSAAGGKGVERDHHAHCRH